MAGQKNRSGGARKGAGRKPLPPEKLNLETPIPVTEIIPTVDEILAKPKKIEKTLEAMQTCDMRNLVCPVEFENMPFAKRAWEYLLELDEHSKYHLLNERHFEAIKSYCIAVEIRQGLIKEWIRLGKPVTIVTRNGEIKPNSLIDSINKQSDRINIFAEDLGLTVMGEFKMAKEKQSSPTLNGEDKSNDEGLFV